MFNDRFVRVLIALGAALLLFDGAAIAAGEALKYKGRELASQAKLTLEQARQIALKARNGKIAEEELEREPGGSGLRFTFDIRDGQAEYEVGVDAATGEILEMERRLTRR